MLGVKSFTAIISPPQKLILAVGGTEERVVGQVDAKTGATVLSSASFMSFSVSADARFLSEDQTGHFLELLCAKIEDPSAGILL